MSEDKIEIEVESDDEAQEVFDWLEKLDFIGTAGYRNGKMGYFTKKGDWVMVSRQKLEKAVIRKFDGNIKSITLKFEANVQGTLDIKIQSDGMLTFSSNFPMDIGIKHRKED